MIPESLRRFPGKRKRFASASAFSLDDSRKLEAEWSIGSKFTGIALQS